MGERLQRASGEIGITPWEALLAEVRRAAYRTTWLDQRVDDEVSRENQLAHESEEDQRLGQAAEVRKWLAESRKERMHMTRVAKMAVDAGLAERYVQSIEVEARLIAKVIERSVGVLDLTYEQKQRVALELRDALADVSTELHERHSAVAALPKRTE
jgi:hypothetical protein